MAIQWAVAHCASMKPRIAPRVAAVVVRAEAEAAVVRAAVAAAVVAAAAGTDPLFRNELPEPRLCEKPCVLPRGTHVFLPVCSRLRRCRNLRLPPMLTGPGILRDQQEAIMSKSAAAAYLNVFTVREFEGLTGQKAKSWTKVGVAFPHREGVGFNLELSALPLDGRLVALVPNENDASLAASG
jgi:hypothetical protein